MRHFILSLMLVACGLCASGSSQQPAPVEPQFEASVAAPIDFDALHREARAALDNLRQQQERKLAMAASAAF